MSESFKLVSLAVSSVVALASGTLYLYGIYSPQLIARCGFSAVDSSYLSFAANIGSSIGGFIAGLLIDQFGPQFATGFGALLEFVGFYALYVSYAYKWHKFSVLVVSMICVGFGSVLAYFSTIKVSTVNFAHNKGAANACPVSAYGLAALFYAFISTIFFNDNTGAFLQFVAWFAGVSIGIGVFFVKLIDSEEPETDMEAHHYSGVVDSEDSESDQDNRGLQYLLKGHRGSLAEVNLIRSDSTTSMFSTMSEASSLSGSISSGGSYSSIATSSPIDMPRPDLVAHTRSSVGNSYLSSSPSPQELKARQLSLRHSSTSMNGSPRAGWFGTPKTTSLKDDPILEDAPVVTGVTPGRAMSGSLQVQPSSPPQAGSPGIHTSGSQLSFTAAKVGPSPSSFARKDSANRSTPSMSTPPKEVTGAEIRETLRAKHKHKHKKTVGQHLKGLVTNKLFVCHWFLNALYCATGQIYIYSVGFIVKAQLNNQNLNGGLLKLALMFASSKGDEDLASPYQALQVSVISFANFLGRLLAGLLSDLISKKMGKSRLWVIMIALLVSLMGQLSLVVLNDINSLTLSSLLIGISYGSVYGALPSCMAETFGSRNFATTWSLVGTGPILLFFPLNKYFGKYYDAHSEWVDDGSGDITRVCLQGNGCYSGIFTLTSCMSSLLLFGYLALIRYGGKARKS